MTDHRAYVTRHGRAYDQGWGLREPVAQLPNFLLWTLSVAGGRWHDGAVTILLLQENQLAPLITGSGTRRPRPSSIGYPSSGSCLASREAPAQPP